MLPPFYTMVFRLLGALLMALPSASGQAGYAYLMDGINDNIEIVIPESVFFSDWTLELWHLPASPDGEVDLQGHDCVMDTEQFDQVSYVRWRSWLAEPLAVEQFYFRSLDPHNIEPLHLAMTHSRDGVFSVFVNGELGTQFDAAAYELPPYRLNYPTRLGFGRCILEANGDVTWERHMQGYVDELRFWDRNLSGAEIKTTINDASSDLCCPILRINGDGVAGGTKLSGMIPGHDAPVTASLGAGIAEHEPGLVASPFSGLTGGPLATTLTVGVATALNLTMPTAFTWIRVQQLPAGLTLATSDQGSSISGPQTIADNIVLQLDASKSLFLTADTAFESREVRLIACENQQECEASTPSSSTTITRVVVVQAQANTPPMAGALFEMQFFGDGGYMELPKITNTEGTVEFWLRLGDMQRNQGIWGFHNGAGSNQWTFFLNAEVNGIYHGYRAFNERFTRVYWEGEPLWTQEPQHIAMTWKEVGHRPEIWCWEWTPDLPCQEGVSTPLEWETWEYTVITYQNGKLITPIDGVKGNWLMKMRMTDPWHRETLIGQEWDGNRQSDFLTGSVAEIRYWDHVRTAQEILDNYRLQLTGAEAGLMHYLAITADDFAQAPAGSVAFMQPDDVAADARWEIAFASQEPRDCNHAPDPEKEPTFMYCTGEASECSFAFRKGYIVRRSRFPNIIARPLRWEVGEDSAEGILPIPRTDPDLMSDLFIAERPDQLPDEISPNDRLRALLARADVTAYVRLQAGSQPVTCGQVFLDGAPVALSEGTALKLEAEKQLTFKPVPLNGQSACTFVVVYEVEDRSGTMGLSTGTVEVRVLPPAPRLLQILALDTKPAGREGLQLADELHFIFDKPTSIPHTRWIGEVFHLFKVLPEGALPWLMAFAGCWSGDGKRLVLSVLEPMEQWSTVLGATFSLRQGRIRGAPASPTVVTGAGDSFVAVEQAFDVRPCSIPGEFYDMLTGTCKQCGAGFRLADSGRECIPCPSGTFSNQAGQLECTACPFGEHQPQAGQISCVACEPGYFSAQTGVTACDSCSTGSFAPDAGRSACLECSIGTFAPVETMAECTACSAVGNRASGPNVDAWVTMTYVMRQGRHSEYIYLTGATNASQCGCDRGYVEFQGHCEMCGEGLSCPGMGLVTVNDGYYVAENSISVFECFGRTDECIGGAPGQTCAKGRTSQACADCQDGKQPRSNGECEECGGGDIGLGIFFTVIGLLILFIVYRAISKQRRALQGQNFLMASICFTHICTLAQQLSILTLMNVEFGEPFASLERLVRIFVFDFEFLGVDCVSTTHATARYVMSLFAILIIAAIMIIVHLIMSGAVLKCQFREEMPTLICVLGTMLLAFYISVVAAVLQPLQCFKHPNGKWTPMSYQSVLCYDSDEHTNMVIISAFGVIIPLSFLAGCVLALRHTPVAVARGDAAFLRAFGFLLFRFRLSAYMFPLWVLFRALLLALTTLIPEISIQLMIFNATLVASALVVVRVRPWRVPLADYFEAGATFALIIVANLAGMLIDDHDQQLLSTISFILIVVGFVAILFGLILALVKYLAPGKKPYQFFLSHHKIGGGATARMLKLVLSEAAEVTRKVFYDSDDLMNLDGLFNTVSNFVDTLVLVGSAEVLQRPWCLGELTIARLKKVPSVCVSWPDFEMPTTSDIERILTNNSEFECLFEYEISLDGIRETIEWVRSLKMIRIAVRSPTGFRYAVSELLGKVASQRQDKSEVENAEARVVITADTRNREAVVTAFVLMKVMTSFADTDFTKMPNILLDPSNVRKALGGKVSHLIVLCSAQSLFDECILKCIVHAYTNNLISIPAVIDSAFAFPTKDDMETMQKSAVETFGADFMASLPAPEALTSAVMALFKEIAVPFPYMASQSILDVRAQEIMARASVQANRGSNRKIKTGSDHSLKAASEHSRKSGSEGNLRVASDAIAFEETGENMAWLEEL